jgi:hypothetical protein
MIVWRIPMLSSAVALLALSTTAIGQTSSAAAPSRTATPFLAALPPRLVVAPTSSPFCRPGQGHRCPLVLVHGGAAGPGLPTIDPAFKLDLPNVRVTFVLQSIANTAVTNGGVVPDADTFVRWTTTGAAAAQEHGGPFGYTVPPPGATWDGDDIYHTIIYDALVLNACESFAPFPVDHEAVIDDGGNELGTFHGVDNTTLDHTGFYNFSYKVRATGVNGRVSDFKFAGKVNVTCSGINSLP